MDRKYIILLMLVIMIAGIITIYSASYVYAYRNNPKSTDSFIKNHFMYIVIGIIFMLLMELVNYKSYQNILWPLYLILSGLLILTKIYTLINGEKIGRWLVIGGFSIQITEFVKIFIIYFMANYISSNRLKISQFTTGITKPFLEISIILLLTFIQPDLGTTIILFLISGTMLFIAGAKVKHLIFVALIVFIIMGMFSFYFYSYQWDRIFHSSTNEQVLNGERGIASGGIIGKGIGKGSEKYTMTQSFTDFILVTFGEEFGMIGLILLLLCYWAIFYYILVNVKFIKDEFGRFYLVGFALYLFLQVLINVSGVLNIIPDKGLTIPLLSYGGSSTIATLLGFGIALNIIRNTTRLQKV